MRWAGVSLVWQLRQLADQLDPWVAEPLEKLRQKVLNGFAKEFYLDGLSMPIAPRDEERFGSQLRSSLHGARLILTLRRHPGRHEWAADSKLFHKI